MLRKIILLTCIAIILPLTIPITTAVAQEPKQAVITADNAAKLVELRTIGIDAKRSGSVNTTHLIFVPDSSAFIGYSPSGIYWFDIAAAKTGKQLSSDWATDLAVSGDGKVLAFVSADCNPGNCNSKVVVLDLATSKVLKTIEAPGFSSSVILSADGTLLLYSTNTTTMTTSGTQTGTALGPSAVHIVDTESGKELRVIKNNDGILGPLFLSPDASQFAFNSMEWKTVTGGLGTGKLHIVDVASGKEVRKLDTRYLVKAISSDWKVAYVDPSVELPGLMTYSLTPPSLVDIETGKSVSDLTNINSFTFNPDATLCVMSGVKEGTISVQPLDTRKSITDLPVKKAKYIYQTLFSPDGTLLVSAYRGRDDKYYATIWSVGK